MGNFEPNDKLFYPLNCHSETGEAAVIVVPLDQREFREKKLRKLPKILRVTTFSEETIDFRIQELDREDEE